MSTDPTNQVQQWYFHALLKLCDYKQYNLTHLWLSGGPIFPVTALLEEMRSGIGKIGAAAISRGKTDIAQKSGFE